MMERVQRKLRKLLLVSSLIMVAGFVAVFAAIFYRISQDDAAAPATELAVEIPSGATVRSAAATGDRITLVVEGPDGKTSVHVFDAGSGARLQTVTVGTGAPAAPTAQ